MWFRMAADCASRRIVACELCVVWTDGVQFPQQRRVLPRLDSQFFDFAEQVGMRMYISYKKGDT